MWLCDADGLASPARACRGANRQKEGGERANVPKRRRRCSMETSELREKTCVCARATAGESEKVSNGAQRLHSAGFVGRLAGKPAEKSEEIRRAAKKGQMSVAAYVTGSPHISVGSSVSSAHDCITIACLAREGRTLGRLVILTGNAGFGLPFCWFADRWRSRTLFPPSSPSSSDPPMSC